MNEQGLEFQGGAPWFNPQKQPEGKDGSQSISNKFLQVTFQQQLWNPEDDCRMNFFLLLNIFIEV